MNGFRDFEFGFLGGYREFHTSGYFQSRRNEVVIFANNPLSLNVDRYEIFVISEHLACHRIFGNVRRSNLMTDGGELESQTWSVEVCTVHACCCGALL